MGAIPILAKKVAKLGAKVKPLVAVGIFFEASMQPRFDDPAARDGSDDKQGRNTVRGDVHHNAALRVPGHADLDAIAVVEEIDLVGGLLFLLLASLDLGKRNAPRRPAARNDR